MSQGHEYLSKKEALAYKLDLLNSILPLLGPTLLKPPPITLLTHDADSVKRKRDEPETRATPPDGNGDADGPKKARHSLLPPKPVSFSVSVDETPAPAPVVTLVPVYVASTAVNTVTLAPVPPPAVVPRQEGFTRDRLRKLAVAYREKGREVKHEGDRTRRDGGPGANRLATLQQADAVMIYVFSYWCDDQAAKQTLAVNWKAIFGLLTFVKSTAEKAGMSIIVGLCLRVEAYTLHRIFLHDQKSAIYRASQITLPPSPALLPTPLPDASAKSPPSPLPAHSPPSLHPAASPTPSSDVLKSFSKSGSELFRFNRLWEEAALLLSPAVLVREAPKTWRLCVETNVGVEAADWGIPAKPWRFAWPVDLQRTQGLVQEIGFARAVLEEVAEREGLAFVPAVVVE